MCYIILHTAKYIYITKNKSRDYEININQNRQQYMNIY